LKFKSANRDYSPSWTIDNNRRVMFKF